MAVYFDPNQMTNAFASGAQIGGGIRRNETQAKLAPMIAAGDYKGANAFAASRGDLEMMDYLRPMAKEADDQAWNKKFGGMLAAGDTQGAAALGFADGRIEQAMGAREYGRALKAEEITDYRTGLEFLDSNAEEVMKNYTPEQRKDEYLRRVAASPFGQDPNIMQALERAGADGIITDDEVISFRRELMTAGERQAKADSDRSFEQGVAQNEQAQSNWERSFAADNAARQAEAARADSYGLNVTWGQDAQGNYVPMQASKEGRFVAAQLPEGVTPLGPGGMAYETAMGKENAKKAAYESTAGRALSAFETKADLLVNQIDTAIDQTNQWNAGVLGQFIAAGDLDGTLDAIGAKAMLSELIAIKEQGGTMGALSDSEGAALRNAAVNVARSQSEKQLDANLRTYRLQVEKTKMTMKKAFEDEYVNGPNAVRGPAAPAAPAATAPNLFENLMNMYLPK
jgi:hypothetical protein